MQEGDVYVSSMAAHQHKRPPPQNKAVTSPALRVPFRHLRENATATGIEHETIVPLTPPETPYIHPCPPRHFACHTSERRSAAKSFKKHTAAAHLERALQKKRRAFSARSLHNRGIAEARKGARRPSSPDA